MCDKTTKLQRQPTRCFCLFVDSPEVRGAELETAAQGGKYFDLSHVASLSFNGDALLSTQAQSRAIQLETISYQKQIYLLMAAGRRWPVSVNGFAAAPVSVLRSGDLLQVGEHVLHVSLHMRPYAGRPDEGHLGEKCGYCRLPIGNEPSMRIYACPCCQLPTHDQGEDVPADKRLECAQLGSTCGHCQSPIVREEGFSYVPEL